jgi:tRNA (5-methylaminomethyl-2-thiouridylate)-methyltransferase
MKQCWFVLFCGLCCKAFSPQRTPILRRQGPARQTYHFAVASDTSPDNNNNNHLLSFKNNLDLVAGRFENLSVEEIQRKLVEMGLCFEKQQQTSVDFSSDLQYASEQQRVPGCISNLKVKTVLIKIDDTNDSLLYRLRIEGTSDSLLSRGLLAVIAACANDQLASAFLELDASSLSDRLYLRRALSRGRNDGIASIVTAVQSQVRSILDGSHDDEQISKFTGIESCKEQQSAAPKPTVALLLSGGVDSSVALYLLKQQGYNVTAFYLKIWLEDELAHLGTQCPVEDDILMCQAVCEQLGVPLEQVSLQEEYKDRVISYTVQEARQGRTPNPDIMCNSRIKFGCFYDAISSRGFDFVATGHYAQLIRDESSDRVRLLRAPDAIKDQSYFLCALTQEQLQRVLFPIGHLQKSQVRELADTLELPNRHRPDSQGLCFLGKVKFDNFIQAYLGEQPGEIVDAATGDLLGRHRGVWYHTVGQRRRIGNYLFPIVTSRGPWYVVAKDPDRNLVYCSNEYGEETFTASRSMFTVENIGWLSATASSYVHGSPCRLTMKIRHGPDLVEGSLTLDDASTSGEVHLDEKDGGLAPGQFVAFYAGDECLGGGVISERHWAQFLRDHDPLTVGTLVSS